MLQGGTASIVPHSRKILRGGQFRPRKRCPPPDEQDLPLPFTLPGFLTPNGPVALTGFQDQQFKLYERILSGLTVRTNSESPEALGIAAGRVCYIAARGGLLRASCQRVRVGGAGDEAHHRVTEDDHAGIGRGRPRGTL